MVSTLPVPVSWTSTPEIFGSSSLCAFTYAREPFKPCSSPVNSTNRIVRFGFAPTFCKARAAASTAIDPVPLSVAPVPRSQESRCAPMITNSSGFSVPRISATVLYTCTGFPLKLPSIAAAPTGQSPPLASLCIAQGLQLFQMSRQQPVPAPRRSYSATILLQPASTSARSEESAGRSLVRASSYSRLSSLQGVRSKDPPP